MRVSIDVRVKLEIGNWLPRLLASKHTSSLKFCLADSGMVGRMHAVRTAHAMRPTIGSRIRDLVPLVLELDRNESRKRSPSPIVFRDPAGRRRVGRS